MKPRIGVTGPNRGGTAAWICTAWAIRLAGGKPVRVTPRRPQNIDQLHGLIIGGGADIDPNLYGEEMAELDELRRANRRLGRFLISLLLAPLIYVLRRIFSTGMHVRGDTERDELEQRLIDEALTRRLPLLGICRGAQLLNVHCGGSLHQDLTDFYEETPQAHSIWPYKEVYLEPASRLSRIVGAIRINVNSLHRQAVNELGPAIQAVAQEPNGVIQGIEHTQLPFAIGVQWHPEYLPQRTDQRRIFRALVDCARQSATAAD